MKRPGDVAIVHYAVPGSGVERPHPVLILRELTPAGDDWLVCMISTRTDPAIDEHYERIDPSCPDYQASGLLGPSTIRYTRLAIVAGETLTGKIGEISADRLMRIRIRLGNWLKEEA